jgi:hypothetical protein
MEQPWLEHIPLQQGTILLPWRVSSFTIGTVADLAGNAMTSTTVPSGANMFSSKTIVIDTTAPTVSSLQPLQQQVVIKQAKTL